MADYKKHCVKLLQIVDTWWPAGLPTTWERWANEARAAITEDDPKEPSDEDLAAIYHDCCRGCEFMDQGGFEDAARVVLSRWGSF